MAAEPPERPNNWNSPHFLAQRKRDSVAAERFEAGDQTVKAAKIATGPVSTPQVAIGYETPYRTPTPSSNIELRPRYAAQYHDYNEPRSVMAQHHNTRLSWYDAEGQRQSVNYQWWRTGVFVNSHHEL